MAITMRVPAAGRPRWSEGRITGAELAEIRDEPPER